MIGITTPALIPSAPSLQWLFLLVALVSMLIGPIIAKKFDKMRFLFIWIFLGVISSLSSMILPELGEYGTVALLIFWGFAFGIGLPSCFALIPSLTSIGERGRAGGITFLATYAVLPLLFILIKDLNIFYSSLMLAGWRCLGLGAFLLHVNVSDATQLKPVSYRSILRRKTFLLYLLPWLAFCLINFLEIPVFEQFFGESMAELMISGAFVVGCFSCVIGGWIMDLRGRRRGIILALVALGLSYVILSLFPNILLIQALYLIIDGIAFGVLTVAFVFVVWGDISNGERGEKFYALGYAPIPIAMLASIGMHHWLAMPEAGNIFFTLASFFLFLAIIPIFFAPELLPEKVVKKRELRKYVEEAKKVAGRD
jgi:hypothetical protein